MELQSRRRAKNIKAAKIYAAPGILKIFRSGPAKR